MSELGDNHSIDDLKLLWESDPSSKVYLELAEEYRKLGRHPEAVEVLEKSLEHRPRDPRGRVALARCLLETGDQNGAVELLEAVTRQDPENMDAGKLLLEGFLQLGDFDRASERLNIYRLLNDRDPEIDHLEYRLSLLKPQSEQDSSAPTGSQSDDSEADFEEDSEEFSEDGVAFDPDPGYASFASALPEESSAYIDAPDMAALLAADTEAPAAFSAPPAPAVAPPVNQGVAFQFEADPDPDSGDVEEAVKEEGSAPEDSTPELPSLEVGPEGEDAVEAVEAPQEVSPGQPSSAAMAAISAASRKSHAQEEEESDPKPKSHVEAAEGPSEAALAAILAASKKAAEKPKKDPAPALADNELPAIEEATGLVPLASPSTDLFELGAPPPKPSFDDLFDLRGPAAPKPTLDSLWGSAPRAAEAETTETKAEANTESASEDSATATLGELYLGQGHLDEAEEIFDRVLRHDPGNAAALAGKAKLETARRKDQDLTPEETPAQEEPASELVSEGRGEPSSAAQEAIEAARRAALGDPESQATLEATEPMPTPEPVSGPKVEMDLAPGVELVPEMDPVPEISLMPEADSEPEAAETLQESETQQSENAELSAELPSGEPSAAARAAIEAASRAQPVARDAAQDEDSAPVENATENATEEAAPAEHDLLTAADLLADRSLKGVIPEGLTAKKILVLDQYAKHLRKTSQDHVH